MPRAPIFEKSRVHGEPRTAFGGGDARDSVPHLADAAPMSRGISAMGTYPGAMSLPTSG